MKKLAHIALIIIVMHYAAGGQDAALGNASGLLQERTITAVAIDKDNNKYLGTEEGLIILSSEGILTQVDNESHVTAITTDTKAGVWYATGKRVVELNSGREIELPSEISKISSIDFSGSDLWIGTDQGLFVASPRDLSIKKQFSTGNSKLPSMQVEEVHVDRSRVKWIGTDNGIVRIENDKWRVYEKGDRFIAITENSEGVWIASPDEVWLVDPFNRWSPTNATNGLRAGEIRALTADGQGNVYILSESLIQFNPYTDLTQEVAGALGISEESSASLVADNNDYLWFGTSVASLQAVNPRDTLNETLNTYAIIENTSCAGRRDGAITLEVKGGTPPYTLTWSDGAEHGLAAKGLGPRDYSVTITDSRRVRKVLTANVGEPAPLSALVVHEEKSDQVKVSVSGGNGGYGFKWMDGSTGVARPMADGILSYEVTVTDANKCSTYAELVIDEPAVTVPTDASEVTAVSATTLKNIDAATLAVGQTLRIEQLFFEADSAGIKTGSFEVLDEVYTFLDKNPGISIEIGGHTNGLPDHDYCDRLSSARARTVAEYLYARGISTDRISFKGYGKRRPLASNATAEGRMKNQRVEIKILQT